MHQLIRGLKERLFQVRSYELEPVRRPMRLYRVFGGHCRNRPHPIETRVLGVGPALLSRQGT